MTRTCRRRAVDLPVGRVIEHAAMTEDRTRLELRISRRLLSPNEFLGMHWRTKGRERKQWQAHIANAVIASFGATVARQLLGNESPLVGCVGTIESRRRVEVTRLVPSTRHFIRDDDNLWFAVKPLLDALKHLALIRDDRRRWMDLAPPTQEVSIDGRFWTWIAVSVPNERGESE